MAFHVWNSAGKALKFPYQRVTDVIEFPWEAGTKKQSWQQMLEQMKTIAAVHNERLKQKEKK